LNYFDDDEQKKSIIQNQGQIQVLNDKIRNASDKLKQNEKYKSILITNGNDLVTVVFEMLEKMLNCNLSNFSDEKKEDFLIKKENITFIGEIKGITSNVKSENIAQIERHYQSYLDTLQEKGVEENVKQILIINFFRTKPLSEREDVNETQIKLAQKYGSLIITTETLLKLFEQFSKNEITTDKIISILSKETGLLNTNSLSKNSIFFDNDAYKI
jgi:hypothetical protein